MLTCERLPLVRASASTPVRRRLAESGGVSRGGAVLLATRVVKRPPLRHDSWSRDVRRGNRATIHAMAKNFERAFSERPEVLTAWQQLNGAIKGGMDLRRYELVTL